jgi:hypothetical protein
VGEQFAAGHVHGGTEEEQTDGHAHEEEASSGPQFGIENFQIGVEASGIINKRIRYVLGLVNGGSHEEVNKAKDGYFRLAYKLGGMAYDGSAEATESSNNWVDNSLAVGIFGYRGYSFNENTFGPKNFDIERLGIDYSWYLGNLNLYGGFMLGSDELLLPEEDEHGHVHGDEELELKSVDFNMFFTEANYVFYPWLMGVLRYEQADPDGMETIKRIVPSISILYRANIKLILESRFDPEDFEFTIFQVGLDFAY